MAAEAAAPLLRVRDLRIEFDLGERRATAVEDVSFDVGAGEVVGMVGESGCGKSVTALSLMRLLETPPGHVSATELRFQGDDLLTLPEREMQRLRGGAISLVFQDPLSALNPVLTIGYQVAEALALHRRQSIKAAWPAALEMLRRVGLPNPEHRARAYPHEISGGQRQRVMIAMAFICEPQLVIADEPTTALDVTVQRQVLDLMLDLRREQNAGILLITHDLGVVAETCDRVLVMYAGRLVEAGTAAEIFHSPRHPYARALLDALPRLDAPHAERLVSISGQPPDLSAMPTGCPFHPRCRVATTQCREEMPPRSVFSPTHAGRCWHPQA